MFFEHILMLNKSLQCWALGSGQMRLHCGFWVGVNCDNTGD